LVVTDEANRLMGNDHFKRVNDTYGHDAGDTVLRAMSSMLIREFRSIDLVGRLGGEEFAVVFPETTHEGAKIASDRLLSCIQAANTLVDGQQINITVSIGLARVTSNTLDGAAILKRVDALLYMAKTLGRNRIIVKGDSEDFGASECSAAVKK